MVTLKQLNRTRVAGIVIHDDALLVMFRRKNGREYYTFPGGAVEEGESLEDAVVREIREEATVTVVVENVRYELHRSFDRSGENTHEYFFACAYGGGEPKLGRDSIEQKINNQDKNFFEPQWVTLSDIKNIPLLPPEIATQLFHDLKEGFKNAPIILEGASTEEWKENEEA